MRYLLIYCFAVFASFGCLQAKADETISFEGSQFSHFKNVGPFNFEIIESGGTPSPNTGPATGANGTNGYVYLEASNGAAYTAGDQAILLAENIDAESIEFYYHMFGDHIGSLSLQAKKNGIWETITLLEGPQQYSNTASWKFSSVSLADFPKPLNIRFVATAAGDYKGDIALDQITFKQNNTPSSAIIANFEDNLGVFSNQTPFLVSRYHGKTPTIDTGPSSGANGTQTYAFLETSAGAANSAGDTGILEANVTGTKLSFYFYMFGWQMGTLKVKAFINGQWQVLWEKSGEEQVSPNEPWHKVYLKSEHYTAIRFEFIANGGYLGDMAIDEVVFDPPEFGDLTNDLEGGINWKDEGDHYWLRQAGSAPSSGTGPSSAHQGEYYALFETSLGAASEAGDTAILKSPELNNEEEICFWFYMFGAEIGTLSLEYTKDNSNWLNLFQISGQQHFTKSSNWTNACASIPENTKYLRYKAIANGGYKGDIAIDNITVNNSDNNKVNLNTNYIGYYEGDDKQVTLSTETIHNVVAVYYMGNDGEWKTAAYNGNNKWLLDFNDFDSSTNVQIKLELGDGSVFYYSTLVEIEYLGKNRPEEAFSKTTEAIPDNSTFSSALAPSFDNTGALKGQASVNGGAAAYHIPIELPPGRAGMRPNVSLNYSSRSGNGIVGVGWSLSAGSSISRCAATYIHDGFVQNVQYNYNDRLCLDGQRLIATSGNYGFSGTEYRTEIDSFVRVTQNGSLNGTSTWFKVEYKNGQVGYFGKSANTRVIHDGKTSAYSWLLEYQHDATSNNFINFSYSEFGAGEKLIKEINYTASSSTEPGMQSVEFVYEKRNVSSFSYISGGKATVSQRLGEIKIQSNNITQYSYTLNYLVSEQSDNLQVINKCFINSCQNPTIIEWSGELDNYKLMPLGTDTTPFLIQDAEYLSLELPRGDVNGDGVRDWKNIFINAEGEENGSFSNNFDHCRETIYTGQLVCLSGDFNLDGFSDGWNVVNNYLQISYTKGSTVNTGVYIPSSSTIAATKNRIVDIADYNGDSYPDLMVFTAEPNNVVLKLYLHSKNLSSPYPQGSVVFNYPTSGNYLTMNIEFNGDITGNGLPDLVVTDMQDPSVEQYFVQPVPDRLLANISTPSNIQFDTIELDLVTNPSYLNQVFSYFADVTGDSLPDWLGWQSGSFVLRINEGGGAFSAPQDLGVSIVPIRRARLMVNDEPKLRNEPLFVGAIKVFDIDNDGKMELLVPDERVVTGCATGIMNFQYPSGVQAETWCGNEIYYNTWSNSASGPEYSINPRNNDDSLYKFKKFDFNFDEYGDVTVRASSTDLVGHAYESTFLDVFGTGLQSFVFLHRKRKWTFHQDSQNEYFSGKEQDYGVYVNRNYGVKDGSSNYDYLPTNLVSSITNGLGVESHWQYLPLSSGQGGINSEVPHYQLGVEYDAGYINFASSMYTVSTFKQSNGLGTLNESKYSYNGAVYNIQGRGFMGFKSIVEEDVSKGIVTQSDFNQVFPYHGKLIRQAIFASEDFEVHDLLGSATTEIDALSYKEIIWKDNPSHSISDVYSVYPETSTTISRLPDTDKVYAHSSTKPQVSTTIKQITDIDQFGNVRLSHNEITDAWGKYKTSESYTFVHDENNWWLDKLTNKTVTRHTVTSRNESDPALNITGSDSQTTSNYVYSDFHANRQARNIVVTGQSAGASSGRGSTTVIAFNDYGLPTQVSQTAQVRNGSGNWVNQTRSTSTSYSKNGSLVAADGYFPYEQKNAKNHITYTEVDPATGQITESRLQLSGSSYLTSTYTYDDYNRPYSSQTDGQPIVYTALQSPDEQAPNNAVLQIVKVSAGMPTQKVYQDKLGRVLRTAVEDFNGDWVFTDVTYNEKGYKTFESVPYKEGDISYGVSYTSYDVLGRLTEKVTNQQCGDMTTSYAYSGLKTDITVSEDCESKILDMSRTYNSLKQLMETVDANDGVTRYSYNSQGLPIVIQDANGNNIIAKYNAFGRKTQVNDPNQGVTNFEYNGFGELQREARVNSKTLTYVTDVLGRVTSRTATGENTLTYTYDGATYGLGQLNQASGNGITKTFGFDNRGRPTTQTINGDSKSFTTTTFYDANYGRVKGLRYPNNLTIEYGYTDSGYQKSVKNAASSYVYKTITDQDVFGNITSANLGNGTSETVSYSNVNGQMLLKAVAKGSNNLMNISYQSYDGFGNLTQVDVTTGNVGIDQHQFIETYEYDNLHRLERNLVDGYEVVSYSYDAVGNLLSKSDYATQYDYSTGSTGGPNAVKRVYRGGWKLFGYDTRGNMTSGDGLISATYNAMDKPTQIVKAGKTLNFTYGPQHMRFKQVNGSVTTFYNDKLYEEEVSGTKTTWRAYVDDIAVISQTTGEGATIRYTHRDRLNSARIFTDHNGYVTAQRNFDPFGKPRLASGDLMTYGNSKLDDLDEAKTRRGFTDHEHLDDVELIHMNGRVYDYNLGRFMSVDPVIQSPTNSQSINPYSYIMNNPLSGTDPTGYASCSADDAASCQEVAENLGKGEKADITQKQSVTGSRIKRDVKVGTMTGNGNGTVNIQIGNMSATADIGAPSTTAKGNNSSGRDLYACTNCFGGSNSIDGVDMPEVIDEYWRERRDGENGYPSTEYLGSRELHHEGLYDGDSEILASGAFETYLNENPRLGLSYNYDLPDAWRMRMPNIVFAPEVKVNVYNVYVNWSIEKTPILDVKIYRQKIRMSSYSNDRKRTFVETRWKYTKEVQQVDSKIQYFESRRRGGVNQVQSWPIVP